MADRRGDITRLLDQIAEGGAVGLDAKRDLAERIYSELKGLSHRRLWKAWRGITLDTTVLVQEAWIRVVEQRPTNLKDKDRRYLFSAFATAMHQLIVDHCRKRRLPPAHQDPDWQPAPGMDVLGPFIRGELSEEFQTALRRFAAEYEFEYEVLMLRSFFGFTLEQITQELGVPLARVRRALAFAKGDLKVRMRRGEK